MGELIARAVKKAVVKAIRRQNGLYPSRRLRDRLEERGIHLDGLITKALSLYPGSIRERFPSLPERLREELEGELEDPNVAGLVIAALYLEDALARQLVPALSPSLYRWERGYFQVGQILGREVALAIGEQEAFPFLKDLDRALAFDRYPPVIANICRGIVAGIVSRVNDQMGLIWVELKIDFHPLRPLTLQQRLILRQGTTVAQALELATQVDWSPSSPSGQLIVEGIEGVKADPQRDLWWLYNINGLHPFNVSPKEYVLRRGDRIEWFLAGSRVVLPVK